MKSTITEQELKNLETMIYNLLMSNPEVGMGEIGECRDAARELTQEWILLNEITVIENQ